MELNLLERAIYSLAPRMALKRHMARKALDVVLAYEGASHGRRTAGWTKVSSASANTEARPAIAILRERSRDLARNNVYGLRAITMITNSMVGGGIRPVFKSKSQAKTRALNDLWQEWGEDDVQGDYDGQGNIYALQGLIAHMVAESGECVVMRHFVKNPRKRIPLEIQVLEPDHIDSSRDSHRRQYGQPFSCLGIAFDGCGKRSGYWLYDVHPGECVAMGESKLHPADGVIHVYRRDRAEQIRGIPWLAPCVLRLKDLDDYEDAQLLRQKIAACFCAFVTDVEGNVSGGIGEDDDFGKLEPGRIDTLPPGKQIAFSSPPGAENYDSYTRQVLRGIAVGTGITYEMLTGDYSQVNFTSGRMGKGDFWPNLDVWQWQMFAPQALSKIGRWFLDAAELAGYDTKGVRIEWVPPRRELVDPTKEIPAMCKSVRSGFTSRQQTIRELGYDPMIVMDEIAEDNDLADEKGLVLDSDPRRTNNGGQSQAKTMNEGNRGDDNGDDGNEEKSE